MADGLQVTGTGRDGPAVYFDVENTGDETLYEFVKLFSGTRYIDLKYITVQPGETERVVFSDIDGSDHRFLLSTNDREGGVIFDDRIDDGSGEPVEGSTGSDDGDTEDTDQDERTEAVIEPDEPDTPPIREQDIDALQGQELSEQRWKELAAEYDDLEGKEREEKQRILERLRKEYEDIDKAGAQDTGSTGEDREGPEDLEDDTAEADVEEEAGIMDEPGAGDTGTDDTVDEIVDDTVEDTDDETDEDEEEEVFVDSLGEEGREETGEPAEEPHEVSEEDTAGTETGTDEETAEDTHTETEDIDTVDTDTGDAAGTGVPPGADGDDLEPAAPAEATGARQVDDTGEPEEIETETFGEGGQELSGQDGTGEEDVAEQDDEDDGAIQRPDMDELGLTEEDTRQDAGGPGQESGAGEQDTVPGAVDGPDQTGDEAMDHPETGQESSDADREGEETPPTVRAPERGQPESVPVSVEPDPDQSHPAVDTEDQQPDQEDDEGAQTGQADTEDIDTRHLGGEPAGSHRRDAGPQGEDEQETGTGEDEASLPETAQVEEAPASAPEEAVEAPSEEESHDEGSAGDELEDRVREMDQQFQQRRQAEEQQGGLAGIVDRIFGRSDEEEGGSEEEGADERSQTTGEEDETGDGQAQDEEGTEGADDDAPSVVPEKGDDWVPPSEAVNRLSTGIIGLDEKMQGGFVEGTMNLVTGKTGVGKTAFCASFLKRGAELNEPGVYVTTEERQEDIRADIEAMFGWRFEELEEAGLVKILSIKPIFPSKEIDNLNRLVRSYISNLLDEVTEAVEDIEADRVIIDSVSIIEMFIRDEYMARVALASLLNNLRESHVTALLTGTVPETSEGLSGGGIIEFLVDTVILLEFVPVAEEHKRTLTIRKMRRTDHDVEIFPFDITPDGIEIYDVM